MSGRYEVHNYLERQWQYFPEGSNLIDRAGKVMVTVPNLGDTNDLESFTQFVLRKAEGLGLACEAKPQELVVSHRLCWDFTINEIEVTGVQITFPIGK